MTDDGDAGRPATAGGQIGADRSTGAGRPAGETVVFTDGACKGNPGPGGWAWAVEGGPWGSGYDPATTNQRMEITAAYQAVLNNPGALRIVSDSTYVVNCFKDEWWKGWRARGWKNSRKEPVANRDLWEPFIELVEQRDVTFEWVKGHSGVEMNELVDALAVAAVERRDGASGTGSPSTDDLTGYVPVDGRLDENIAYHEDIADPLSESSSSTTPREPAVRDRRAPQGTLWSVVGYRSTDLVDSADGLTLRSRLAEIIAAQQQMYPDLVVLTGVRPGAEQIGALAAADAGVPYVVVLPYPDPIPPGDTAQRKEFDALCRAATSTVTLESRRPKDNAARAASLARRDGWLRSVSSGAAVVTGETAGGAPGSRTTDRAASSALRQLKRFTEVLGDEVWEISVS